MSRSSNLWTAALAVLAIAGPLHAQTPVDGRFTIAVIPDTQNYTDHTHQTAAGFAFDARDQLMEQMRFIADNAASRGGDIVFATSVGDVWQYPTTDVDPDHAARGFAARQMPGALDRQTVADRVRQVEIPTAIEAYRILDGVLPFSVVPGNHDYDAQWWEQSWPQDLNAPEGDLRRLGMIHIGGLTGFTEAFGAASPFFADRPWYVASHDGGADSAQVFEAGGYRFLHIGLQMAPSDASLKWAETVIHAHPGLPTLISTHDFLDKTGARRAHPVVDLNALDPYDNSPQGLWEKLITRNPQVFMVLSGHHAGQAFRTDANSDGSAVYQLLSDYQDRRQSALDAGMERAPGIGDGWLRLLAFDMTGDRPTVRVRTYSTHYDRFASDTAEYVDWYRDSEQPQMSDEAFVAADDFVIRLEDFRARFGQGAGR